MIVRDIMNDRVIRKNLQNCIEMQDIKSLEELKDNCLTDYEVLIPYCFIRYPLEYFYDSENDIQLAFCNEFATRETKLSDLIDLIEQKIFIKIEPTINKMIDEIRDDIENAKRQSHIE
jgi:hypothetical protein